MMNFENPEYLTCAKSYFLSIYKETKTLNSLTCPIIFPSSWLSTHYVSFSTALWIWKSSKTPSLSLRNLFLFCYLSISSLNLLRSAVFSRFFHQVSIILQQASSPFIGNHFAFCLGYFVQPFYRTGNMLAF